MRTVFRDEADMSVQKLDEYIALMERLQELAKEETNEADEQAKIILSDCSLADYPDTLELIKETEMSKEERDLVKRSPSGHIMAFTGDADEPLGHCVPVGVITKQEKASVDASEDLAAIMLLLHKIVSTQMMLTASAMQGAEDCGIFRLEESCNIRNADGSQRCLWKDDACTDSPGYSAEKVKIAAEKLRDMRTRLLEVRRALSAFPTQYTPDMPAPAIPDPTYDSYRSHMDKLTLLQNNIHALEVTAQNAINTINKSSQQFTEARALEEECSIHKTYGNCYDAGFCSIWVQRAGEDGGLQEGSPTEETKENVIDGKGALCIPTGGFKTGRMTTDKNNRVFFWSETGMPDVRATSAANNKGLFGTVRSVGLVNWWRGNSVDATEAAASLDAALSEESSLADHHKIRLLQMRLKQLEVQMRKQYTAEPSGQPSNYDGPYPRNADGTHTVADKRHQAKQDRFEALKQQYIEYLQDYNNLLNEIALDAPGTANDLASVFYDNSDGLLEDLQKSRGNGVKHSKQLRFLLECAAHNFVEGEHVQYFWYDDRRSLANMAAKTSEMTLRDTNRTGVVIAQLKDESNPNLLMNRGTAKVNTGTGYPSRNLRTVKLEVPKGYEGDVLYMRKHYVTKTVAAFATDKTGETDKRMVGSYDTQDGGTSLKALEKLTGMPTPRQQDGTTYVGTQQDMRPLYLIKVKDALQLDENMKLGNYPHAQLKAAELQTGELDAVGAPFYAALKNMQQRNKSIMRTVGFDDRLVQKLQSQIMLSTLTSNRGFQENTVGGLKDQAMGAYHSVREKARNWFGSYSPLRRMKGGDYDVQSLSTGGDDDIVSYMNSLEGTPSLMSTEGAAPSLMSTASHAAASQKSEEELVAPAASQTSEEEFMMPSLMSTATHASAPVAGLEEVSLMSTATKPESSYLSAGSLDVDQVYEEFFAAMGGDMESTASSVSHLY